MLAQPGHSKMRSAVSFLLFAALAGAGLVAHAAPLQADHAASSPEAGLTMGVRALPQDTGARTLDLLIEMQPRAAGVEFNERNRSRDRASPIIPARVVKPEPAQEQNQTVGGLFGSGAAPQVNSNKLNSSADPAWQGVSASTSADGAVRGSTHADSGPRVPLLPKEVVHFIRENRGWIIASAVALLALMWGGSMLVGRMQR